MNRCIYFFQNKKKNENEKKGGRMWEGEARPVGGGLGKTRKKKRHSMRERRNCRKPNC
jgi:hypothetical protein